MLESVWTYWRRLWNRGEATVHEDVKKLKFIF